MNRLSDLILDSKLMFELPHMDDPEHLQEIQEIAASDCMIDRVTVKAKEVREKLSSCPIIMVDNVTEYFFEVDKKEYWYLDEDFPNCAPPFQCFFIETKSPGRINSDTYGETPFNPNTLAWGTLIEAEEFSPKDYDSKGRWKLKMTLFIDRGVGHASMTHVALSYFIASSGQICSDPGLGIREEISVPREFGPYYGDRPDLVASHFRPLIDVILLAICFMNCKNVTMESAETATRQQRRARARQGMPLLKHYVLEIDPMKMVLKSEGRAEDTGLKQALHICRGHFKDYTESGLFGKHHGVYWWHETLRGNTSKGVVVKDYDVLAPPEV